MPGRILNFSEFFGKYSKDSGAKEKNLDTFTQSSANFEEGFDKDTYDQTQLGPNKPVAGGSDTTPALPGEAGAPQFSSTPAEEMEAPEATETEEQEENETPEATETEEQEGTEETPEPEAGANPEEDTEEEAKPAVTESRKFKGIMNFAQFVNESNFNYKTDFLGNEEEEEHEKPDFDYRKDFLGNEEEEECETCGDQQYSSEFEDDENSCPNCREPYNEYGANCGCNM